MLLLHVSLLLLLLLTVPLVLTSLLHLLAIPISPVTALLSVFLAVELFLYIRRNSDRRESIRVILLTAAIVGLSLFLASRVYDLSYDGNWYHKASLGSLANGWNPIYSSLEDFAANPDGVKIGNLAESAIWADHYCKASWIIGANIYVLTGNIECAKAINILATFIAAMLVFTFLKKRIHTVPAFILSLLTAANPIPLSQLFTFYIDGLLALMLTTVTVLLLMLHSETEEEPDKRKAIAVCLFSAIVICTNIKFTGLAYAAVFCFAFYLYGILRSAKNKTFKKYIAPTTVFFGSALAVSLFLVGSSSYIKNLVEHKNPLYPLIGSGSVDIMTRNQPRFFDDLGTAKKLFYSLFSRTDNIIGEGTVILKQPFDISPYEARMASSAPDLRIGGFGPLFGGILILSAAVLLFAAVYLLVKNRSALLLALPVMLPSVLLPLLISESWWARYVPFLYFLPIAALLFLVYLFSRTQPTLRPLCVLSTSILCILLTVNCAFPTVYIAKCACKSSTVRDRLTYARVISDSTPVNIAFSSYAYYGIEFNFRDSKINYSIVAEAPETAIELYADKARMYLPESEVQQ